MSVPGGRRFVPTQGSKEPSSGNEVMAELQAILRGRRATTEKVLGSSRAQRKVAGGGKSNSVSEKRFNSTENLSTVSREMDNTSPPSPGSNAKWHVPTPKKHQPLSSKGNLIANDSGAATTTTVAKRPINPPLKSSPIPIPGSVSGSGLIPDPGLTARDVIESPQNRHRPLAFTTSVGAVVNTSVGSGNQAASQKAALTQSLPKSNVNRIGPPPNAPPPRLHLQSVSATTVATVSPSSSPQSASKSSGNSGGKKTTQASKQTSLFSTKVTQKTSNITFNEPVKVTKKGAAKKGPLVSTKGSSSVGIKRLLFMKKGNKKASSPSPAPAASGREQPNPMKKAKTEIKFRSRPSSPEVDIESYNTALKLPVSSSIPTSTSTPAFGYQNVFEDEVFQRQNRHRIEEVPIDKKPKPLPRKTSVGNISSLSTSRKSALEPYEMAGLIREEELYMTEGSGTESPSHDQSRSYTDNDSPSYFIGSPPQQNADKMGVPMDKRPLSPSTKFFSQSTSSLGKVVSPTMKGKGPPSLKSPPSPEAKQQSSVPTDVFQSVAQAGSRVSLLSDLTQFPLFHPDPALSSVSDQKNDSAAKSYKEDSKNSSSNQGLLGSVPVRRQSTPKKVHHAVHSDSAQLDAEEGEDEYIAMGSFRVSSNLNFLDVSQEGTFPMDPRASGYYLKILAPNEKPKTKKKNQNMEGLSDGESPSSPEPYDEVNFKGIIAVPVIEPVTSPENEYISINTDHPHSHAMLVNSEQGRTETNVGVGRVDTNNDWQRTPSPVKQFRRTSVQRDVCNSPSPNESTTESERPADSRMTVRDGPGNLKYSDVTINPVSSTGHVIKRKPSALKKFSYQLVQVEQGKKNKLVEVDTTEPTSSPLSSHTARKRDSQDGTIKLMKEENDTVTVQSLTEKKKQTGLHSKMAAANSELEENKNDTLSRLADRPLPKVPKQEKKQHDEQQRKPAAEEKLYYTSRSSFLGRSDSADPQPLCVSIPAKTPSGTVVWHEYVEIDQDEIERMGGALPPLPPGQLLQLIPLLKNGQKPNSEDAPVSKDISCVDDFADDVSDTCSIYRSDSLESCPYIEPPQVGSPPVVPYRPDNLDELVEQKSLQSGEYSYAAVPGKSFGVKWMRFQGSDPRHIRLAPFSPRDLDIEDSQGYILATPGAMIVDDSQDNSGGRRQKETANQSKSKRGEVDRNQDGLNPPVIPPKTASLLREQKLLPVERPQSYLIPVFTNKANKVVQGGETLSISTRDKSKSTSHLSSTRDAATGERMERQRGEPTKNKRTPPPKPKPYKDFLKQHGGTYQGGMEVVLVNNSSIPYIPDNAEGKFLQKLDIMSGEVALGHTKLRRDKSQSTGNLLETSNDFDTREKWIDSKSRHDSTANVATISKRMSEKKRQQLVVQNQERGKLSKQSHKPFRSDAVKRKQRKTSDESMSPEAGGTSPAAAQGKAAVDLRSMALIRQNRDTIVKHLSRALDTEQLELDFGQNEEPVAEAGKRRSSQSETARGLGDILAELDELMRNNVFSREDLLSAIQSQLNIKVNIQEEPNTQGKKEQSKQSGNSESIQNEDMSDSTSPSEGASNTLLRKEDSYDQTSNKHSGMGGKAHYVNEELLPRLKSMKTTTYTPPYANHTYIPESDDSAPNSQSSDQSSSTNESGTVSRFSRYENLDNWIESSNKSNSDSSTHEDAAADATSAEYSTGSTRERSRRTSAPTQSMRGRSQSSIDVSPQTRRKKFSVPEPSKVSEKESPSHGYQLALKMEEERLYNIRGTRPSLGGVGNEIDSSRRKQATSTYGQSSKYQSTDSTQRSSTGQTFDSVYVPGDDNCSEQSPNEHLREPMSPNKSKKVDGSGSSSFGTGSSLIRGNRSFTVGSFHSKRRPFNSAENDTATGQSTFVNGVGVFTHMGGVLMNAGSGVVIEIPEDAIPQGKKQKIWFDVIQDVFNPLHEEEVEASQGHPFTDSFQFHTGSTEFENYLAGKRERKVQLGPVILIGPSDAALLRPIKIKMPHCLPYRNNSWHLHMFARAKDSEVQEWTELSNTIGLIELPPKRTGNKSYRKSSYQMHIDYTQVIKMYLQ